MRRTIDTALTTFSEILKGPYAVPFEIWPDLREAHDAICNKGASRVKLVEAFPALDFSLCREEWDYEEHSNEAAIKRAERAKAELWRREEQDIVIISHRAFISYLVAGSQFSNCGEC